MNIRFAENRDMDLLIQYDKHISKGELKHSIQQNHIYLADDSGHFAGWLRYGLFWDSIPFMNLLYVLEEFRGKGFGKGMVTYWENEMRWQGYETFMTSTRADEYAQHFYFKLGYRAVGGFQLGNEPYEVIFSKSEIQ